MVIEQTRLLMQRKQKGHISSYMSLVKFSHTVFAMPFAFIGYFIALKTDGTGFDVLVFGLVILCMVFARNASMAFNRFTDREFDSRNPRTALREIPRGIIKAKSALAFVVINALLFIAATYFINRLVFLLSPLALFIVLGYSLTKRFTALSHFILGLGLSIAPIGAYLSVTGKFHFLPLLFSGIVLLWVAGFDIIYALQDIEQDKKEKLKSLPVRLGAQRAVFGSLAVHILAAALVVFTGFIGDFGLLYFTGSSIFIAMLGIQHLIIGSGRLEKINLAFFTANGLASIVFAAFTIADILVHGRSI